MTARKRRLPAGARERAAVVAERLAVEYPGAECELVHDGPWQLLVATILSAQTTDERVNSVTPALFARYPTPAALARADQDELQAILRPTGFFRSKARAVTEMSLDLVERFDGEVPPRMEDLVTLRGVGRKTANVILGVAFGLPGLAVDTHVTRLTRLLKLTGATDPVEIETDVCSLVPPEQWARLGLRLILHGRRVCIARRPRCDVCVLNDICPSAFVTKKGGTRPTPRRGQARMRPIG